MSLWSRKAENITILQVSFEMGSIQQTDATEKRNHGIVKDNTPMVLRAEIIYYGSGFKQKFLGICLFEGKYIFAVFVA